MVMTDKIKEEKMEQEAYKYCEMMESSSKPSDKEDAYWWTFHQTLLKKKKR